MSVVVLGLSHRSAPITVLESVALDADRAAALARAVRSGENIGEAVVLATCNRVEVYADAATFHGAVTEIGDALAAAAGVSSILNVAPSVLVVPEGVDVRKVDLSTELQILAFHEQRKALAGEGLRPLAKAVVR